MELSEIIKSLELLCSEVRKQEKKVRLTSPLDLRLREVREVLDDLKEIIQEADYSAPLHLDGQWRKLNTALQIFTKAVENSRKSTGISIKRTAENMEFIAQQQESLIRVLSDLEALLERRIDALRA